MRKTFVSLDIETTDLDPKKGDIIEIGVLKFTKNLDVDEFRALIKPSKNIPGFISAITGIKNEDVKGEKDLSSIKDELIDFVGKCPIIGHNISFDLNFLKNKGISFRTHEVIDTWRLAMLLLPHLSSHSLEVLTSELNITHLESHRAFDDARATKDLFLKLIKVINRLDLDSLSMIVDFTEGRDFFAEIFFLEAFLKKKRRKKEKQKSIFDLKQKVSKKVIGNKIMEDIETFFSEKRKVTQKYFLREPQIDLLKTIDQSLFLNNKLIIEAESGIGKKLPIILGLIFSKQKKSALILKDRLALNQVLEEDIPLLKKMIKGEPNFSFLPGSNDYLCLRRFECLKKRKKIDENTLHLILKVLLFIPVTREGFLSDLPLTFDERKETAKICYKKHFCLKSSCSFFNECYYFQALKKQKKASIYLILHDRLREFHGLLSEIPFIMDDFEDFEDNYETKNVEIISINSLIDYLEETKDVLKTNIKEEKVRKELFFRIEELKNQCTLFFGILAMFVKNNPELNYGRLTVNPETLSSICERKINIPFEKIIEMIKALNDQIKSQKHKNQIDVLGITTEGQKLISLLSSFFTERGDCLQEIVLNEKEIFLKIIPIVSKQNEIVNLFKTENHSRILISQNLTNNFVKLQKNIFGLINYSEKRIKSHFRIEEQTKTYIIEDFLDDYQPSFYKQLRELLILLDLKSKRGSIVLLKNKGLITDFFKKEALFLKENGLLVIFQGTSGGKEKLEKKIRDSKKVIYVTTLYFLEKMKVRKDAFENVVLHKLPFKSPRTAESKDEREQDFMKVTMPRAIQAFKKVFNYLLQDEKDTGKLFILDKRVRSAAYARAFLQSIEPTKIKYCGREKLKLFL